MVDKLFQVIFSKKARKKLKDISDHYKRSASPAVAKKVRNRIKDEAKKLERVPESKPILPGTEDMDFQPRYTKAWSFKIIFRVINPTRIVRILTIRHDKEDPDNVKEDL